MDVPSLEKQHTRREALEFVLGIANLISANATGADLRAVSADPKKMMQIAAAIDAIMYESTLPTATVDTPQGPVQVVLLADVVYDETPAVSDHTIEFHGPDGGVVAKAVPLANGGFDPKRVAVAAVENAEPHLQGHIRGFRTAAEFPSDHDEPGWPNSAF